MAKDNQQLVVPQQQLVFLPLMSNQFVEIAPGALISLAAITMVKVDVVNGKAAKVRLNLQYERDANGDPVWIVVHDEFKDEVAAICQTMTRKAGTGIVQASGNLAN